MRTLGISFWKNALLHIDKGIKALEIFCCDTDGRLKSINSLRTLDHDYLDKDGNLLSNDLPLALYLSQKYDIKDLVSLELYGLQSLTVSDIIDIVSFGLSKGIGLSGESSRRRSNIKRSVRESLLTHRGSTAPQVLPPLD
ncbi:hypothetical protein F5Y09DRAFT_3386 [Xylaria sp. FL1042]|nr:hypothetical protein F5Y09DRAFT_3386 [Xylaria sp. FL1042]